MLDSAISNKDERPKPRGVMRTMLYPRSRQFLAKLKSLSNVLNRSVRATVLRLLL